MAITPPLYVDPFGVKRRPRYVALSDGAVDIGEDTEILEDDYDLGTLNTSGEVQITELDGVAIKDNAPIIVGALVDALASSIGGSYRIGIRLRRESDQQWITAGYRNMRFAGNFTAAQATVDMFELDFSSVSSESPFEIHNLTVDAPTIFTTHQANPSMIEGILPVAEKHDAIALVVKSTSGTPNWVSGTMYLQAPRFPPGRIRVESWDFDVLPDAASVEVSDLHKNDEMGNFVGINVIQSSASRHQVQFGKGGAWLDQSGDYVTNDHAQLAETTSLTQLAIGGGTNETVASHRAVKFQNLRSNAPAVAQHICYDAVVDSDTRRSIGAILDGTQDVDAVRYGGLTVTSNFTAGQVYGVFYRGRHSVEVVSLGDGTASEIEMLDIKPFSYITSLDIGQDGAGAVIGLQIGNAGGYVTSANHSVLSHRGNNTLRQSTTDVAHMMVENSGSPQWVHTGIFGIGLAGAKQSRPFVHTLQGYAGTPGNGSRINRAINRVVLAASYDRMKLMRTSGNFPAGRSLWLSKLRKRV